MAVMTSCLGSTYWRFTAESSRHRADANLIPGSASRLAGFAEMSGTYLESPEGLAESQDEPNLTPPPASCYPEKRISVWQIMYRLKNAFG